MEQKKTAADRVRVRQGGMRVNEGFRDEGPVAKRRRAEGRKGKGARSKGATRQEATR